MKNKRTYNPKTATGPRDRLYHFILADGSIRGAVVNGTDMVKTMRRRHELGILETLVLGHGYLAGALLSGGLKGNDRIKLQIECSGSIKGMSVEANAFGEVRGFLSQVPIPIEQPLTSFNLSPYFGAGFLSITRYLEDGKQPFTGRIMMENGSLAKDLALYNYQSDQTPSAYALSITFQQDGSIAGAGGLLLQVLPGAKQRLLEDLEAKIVKISSLGDEVIAETFPEKWLKSYLGSFAPKLLGHKSVEFICHCHREKIKRMLTLLDINELKDMMENGPFPVEIRCRHCNSIYKFSQRQLDQIYAARRNHL